MTQYVVRFTVPVEVVVRLDADDPVAAEAAAWEIATEHTRSSSFDDHARGVRVIVDLDGRGADEVTEL